ncbi:recombination protein RecR [bacterium]|nr:recombination protein RecR [bacterium]
MSYPKIIKKLIEDFQKFPSVGPKTAERYVFHLLKKNDIELKSLANSIEKLKNNTTKCSKCLCISETNPCNICSDKNRNDKVICIVSSNQEMISIENTKKYNGLYFILGGLINTIENIGPQTLNLKQLLKKIKEEKIEEVILALSPTVEGETTTLYLSKILKDYPIKITRLARGLSAGSSLEYADEITITEALKYRNDIQKNL